MQNGYSTYLRIDKCGIGSALYQRLKD